VIARVAIIAALIAAPANARADYLGDPPPRARQLDALGRELHARGEYEAALEAFKEAYALAPSPALLFNMAQAHRLRGDCQASTELYRRFLATSPSPDARDVAGNALRVVESCLAGHADATARHTEESGPVSTNFYSIDTSSDGTNKRRIGLVLTTAGVLSLGTGALFAVDARRTSRKVTDAYADGTPWRDLVELDARGRRSSTLATIFAVGGAAATIGGGALYWIGRREGRADRATVTFRASSPRDATVGMTWPF
jgi:tetratricopeptide (TPR) repeat protein